MTLAQALKKKNRLTEKINKLQQEIQIGNSIRADSQRKIKVDELATERQKSVDDLIRIKIAIFVASTPQRENILRLSELKSAIVFLQGIDTKEGKINEYGIEATVEYAVEFDSIWVKNHIEECEKTIDVIQDELDTFNHTTDIEIKS